MNAHLLGIQRSLRQTGASHIICHVLPQEEVSDNLHIRPELLLEIEEPVAGIAKRVAYWNR